MITLLQYQEFPGIYIGEFRIITYYGLSYLIGFLISIFVYRKSFAFDTKLIKYENHLINYCIIGTIIGGRVGYWIFYNYQMHLIDILMIWNGGMSFYGGFVGVVLSLLIFAKRYRFEFFQITDIVATLSPIIIFCVRIGNFINQEAVGIVAKYGIIFLNYDNQIRIPVQIFEAIFEGIIIFMINIKYKKQSTSRFLILYSISRIICEFFREEDSYIETYCLKYNQWLAIPILLLGLILRLYRL